MSIDKLFDRSDAHQFRGVTEMMPGRNAELIQRMNEPELYYPGNFDTVKRANAILMCLCQEAADALEAADKEIDSLCREMLTPEVFCRIVEWLRDPKPATAAFTAGIERQIAYAIEVDVMPEVKRMQIYKTRAEDAEQKLFVTQAALRAICRQTESGTAHSIATYALIKTGAELG